MHFPHNKVFNENVDNFWLSFSIGVFVSPKLNDIALSCGTHNAGRRCSILSLHKKLQARTIIPYWDKPVLQQSNDKQNKFVNRSKNYAHSGSSYSSRLDLRRFFTRFVSKKDNMSLKYISALLYGGSNICLLSNSIAGHSFMRWR